MDALFLGYETALEYWRRSALDLASGRPLRPADDTACAEAYASSGPVRLPKSSRELVLAGIMPPAAPVPSIPMTLVVPRRGLRGQSNLLHCRVWGTALPPHPFVQVGPRTFVASPAFCFLQLASIWDLPRLVCLGFELCGTYAIDPTDTRGFRPRDPLARSVDLRAACASVSAVRGIARARDACAVVVDGAASPMESVVAAELCLPARCSGFSVPLPELNFPIPLSGEARRLAGGRAHVRCDLYWPKFRLAVEYDSDAWHTGSERISRDAERRNALASMGVDVVTVTRRQLAVPGGLERVANLLERKMGLPPHRPVGASSHAALHRALMAATSCSPR